MVVGDRGGEMWKLALAEGVDDAGWPAAGVSSLGCLCAGRPRNKNPARTPLLAFGWWEGPLVGSPGMIGSDHWPAELASDLTAMQPQPRTQYIVFISGHGSLPSREM
jgi:hypothetical protein